MRFLVRKRRQGPTIIIVALIDILIVMLIFLMATTAFKQQPALKLALPESSEAKRTGADEAPPLVVTIEPSGTLRFGANNKPVTVQELAADLSAASAKDPQVKVAIRADTKAPFGVVVKVMDAIKAAGIKSVNAFTREATK